jgi:hypothetical protein
MLVVSSVLARHQGGVSEAEWLRQSKCDGKVAIPRPSARVYLSAARNFETTIYDVLTGLDRFLNN